MLRLRKTVELNATSCSNAPAGLSGFGRPIFDQEVLRYSARTLLVPVFLMGGLMEVASAQHKYIFPQFAFGGGWESTLMVQALGSNTTCTF